MILGYIIIPGVIMISDDALRKINPVFNYLINYFWLCWVFAVAHWLSLVAVSEDYSLAEVHGHLIMVSSLVTEHGLLGAGTSVVAGLGL